MPFRTNLSAVFQDDRRAARMLVQEIGHIVRVAIDNDPARVAGVVLCDFSAVEHDSISHVQTKIRIVDNPSRIMLIMPGQREGAVVHLKRVFLFLYWPFGCYADVLR